MIGVLIATGAFLTDVDRLPLKSQSELCVVRVTDKAKSLAFVGSPRGKMRDYTLKTKAGSLIVKIKYYNTQFCFQIKLAISNQAPVVQTLDSVIHRINHYPPDKY